MKIIKHSKLEYSTIKHYGRCPRCGCEFIADIQIADTLNGGQLYINTDRMDNLCRVNNEYVCDCPECGWKHVLLTETV